MPHDEANDGVIEPRAVLAGSMTAFICVGMGLAAALVLRNVLDWEKGPTTLVATLFAVVGFVLGGFRAGLACPSAPLSNGGIAAMLAYIPLGVAQRVAAHKQLNPLTLLMAALFAACIGVLGGYVANNANRRRGASGR